MENLSHSLRHNNKISRKSSHANAAAKGIYDDVFGGPPKFGVPASSLSPRAEDYKEIFGGFHAPRVSSIPVLDLPVVDEQEVYFDVRSPAFDYSEVFGGFHGSDFLDGYEEVFGHRRGGSAGCRSSDGAWTPETSEYISEESDHSGANQCFSDEVPSHSFKGDIEYNISYHKANARSDAEITNGLRHTLEIGAVPGYSYMVDQINPYQAKKEKHLKKARSNNSNGRNYVRRQRDYERINSCPGEMFVTISDVSLRTEPSHLPPPSRPPPAGSTGEANESASSWKTGYVEENGNDCCTSSPSFFDVEVDTMMKSQAQVRSAKELMKSQKKGSQSRVRMGSNGEVIYTGRKNLSEEIVHGISRGQSSEMKKKFMEESPDVIGTKCGVQNSTEGEKIQSRLKKRFSQKVQGEESEYGEMFGDFEEDGQWKKGTQLFEMEGMIKEFEGRKNYNKMKTSVERRECNEGRVPDANNVSSRVADNLSIGKNTEKKEKAKKMLGKTRHDGEAVVKQKESESSEDCESLNDVLIEMAREFEARQVMDCKKGGLVSKGQENRRRGNVESLWEKANEGAENEWSLRDAFELDEKDMRMREVLEERKKLKEVNEGEENEKRKVNLELAENKWKLEETAREGQERRSKEAVECEENEHRLREAREQADKKKLKEAREREENEKKLREIHEQEEERKRNEALEKEEIKKRLGEARKGEDIEERVPEAKGRDQSENSHREAAQGEIISTEDERDYDQGEIDAASRDTFELEELDKWLKEAVDAEEHDVLNNADKKAECIHDDSKSIRSDLPASGSAHVLRESRDAINKITETENKEDGSKFKDEAREKKTERLRREQEMEMERLRKIEEEREREREREKDRMAVDRATLEARERAYAETRERAGRAAVERATAEARQRSLFEARERLERVCAEAREKTSAEARIRSERAAVGRATAEARERAASRYSGTKQTSITIPSDQTAVSTSSSRYQYSSGHGAYTVENSEEAEGESAQRCRARLERHRRTAERAAKALAEKNMRDLQTQREQAERNRLAETLDADVKRWSNGKEGNLRALLSTLQYILGPDSGWHPIPLTEVITSAAVKKAYRKATLCVHPDKLQQRGASIQQKYICEKVFDLLKEAWNRFNSEER